MTDRRDMLADALIGWQSGNRGARTIITDGQALDLADALLPTVDALIRQAQAEILDDAARELHVDPLLRSADFASYVTGKLRGRAAALRVTTDQAVIARPDNEETNR